ncbi:hypothetical protein ZWY2020_030255 [Hordeum vulgare]|nr:hypothetical protein ZWY2020_030255 [Hordeum vulgare]
MGEQRKGTGQPAGFGVRATDTSADAAAAAVARRRSRSSSSGNMNPTDPADDRAAARSRSVSRSRNRVVARLALFRSALSNVPGSSSSGANNAFMGYPYQTTSTTRSLFSSDYTEFLKDDETPSGGSACRWYLNEDIPEIDDCFERLGDDFPKIQWISNGAEKFAVKRNRVVSQKYTLAVSVTQKSLSQRNISFQVNGIETFLGRQNSIPHDTRAPAVMPVSTPSGSSRDHALTLSTKDNSVDTIPELPIVAEKEIKKTSASRVPLRHLLKRKATDGFVGVESSTEFTPNDASSDGTALLPITLPISAEELTVVSPSSADDPTPPKKSSAEELTLVSPTSADDPTPPKKSKMDNTVVSPSDTGKSRRRPVAANKEN